MRESIIAALHNNGIEEKKTKKQEVAPTINIKVHVGKKKEIKQNKKKKSRDKKRN